MKNLICWLIGHDWEHEVNMSFVGKLFWFIVMPLFILWLITTILMVSANASTKVYIGEDLGKLTYGLQIEVPLFENISYFAEIESWLTSPTPDHDRWEITAVEYTLELNLGQITIGHKCQHYIEYYRFWDSQNYIYWAVDLPNSSSLEKEMGY